MESAKADKFAMLRAASLAMMAAAILALAIVHRAAGASVDVELWRLDCGEFLNVDRSIASDVFAYEGKRGDSTNSCYLIRHNKDYMLWDTGFSLTVPSFAPKTITNGQPIVAQLSQLQIKPEQISVIGISHSHPDHLGQAIQFPQARLLMGKADFDFVASQKSVSVKDKYYDLSPWLTENAKAEPITGDKDVFGDGSVIMLSTPGHTPGHHSLLVRLPKSGPVILSGDLWAMADQLSSGNMMAFTPDRAQALASMDRVLKIAANLKADIIIQHELLHIKKLPEFPSSAR